MSKQSKFLKALTTEQLISLFEATEHDDSENIPTVRDWLMSELESRDATAFDKWLNTIPCVESPRAFYGL